jgi:hypothetical protein
MGKYKPLLQRYIIKHEFIMRFHKGYTKEGIMIRYPIKAVNYEQEGAK